MSGKTKIILCVILALLLGTAGCSDPDADIPPALDLLLQKAEEALETDEAPEADAHADETLGEAVESHVEPAPELEALPAAEEKMPAPSIEPAAPLSAVPAAISIAEPVPEPTVEPVAEAVLEFAAELAATPAPEPVVTPSPAPTPAPIIGYIDARSLNLREDPDRDSAVAGEFEGGQKVEITGEDGDWYKVRVDGSTGYMLKEYIVQRVPTETEPVATAQTAAADNFPEKEGYIDAGSLNMRAKPSRDADIIREYSGGQRLKIVGEEGDWYKVEVNGSTGYMLKAYIAEGLPAKTEKPAAAQISRNSSFQEKEGYIDAGSLNMRAKPSRDADIIREYSGGQQLKIIGEEGEWYKVAISGVTGYMIKEHVGLGTAPKATAAPSRSTKQDIASSKSGEVWVPTNGGKKYHSNPGCSQMIDPAYVTLEKAESLGFTACKKCY